MCRSPGALRGASLTRPAGGELPVYKGSYRYTELHRLPVNIKKVLLSVMDTYLQEINGYVQMKIYMACMVGICTRMIVSNALHAKLLAMKCSCARFLRINPYQWREFYRIAVED